MSEALLVADFNPVPGDAIASWQWKGIYGSRNGGDQSKSGKNSDHDASHSVTSML